MAEHTNKEHYIPQFVLRKFEDKNRRLSVADISNTPIRYFVVKPGKIFFQKDIYETKNVDGTYYSRNSIEKRFADIEKWLAIEINRISCLST